MARAKSSSGRAVREQLSEYRRKRDFGKTAEPEGSPRASAHKQLEFVIQKHAASHLHFDLRLEIDGVMKSWAVPKGPNYDPKVRRLAMQVEDHPIEYNSFEGTIPKGEYGGGTVMIWDRGTYEAEDGGGEQSLREGYRRGDLKVVFHGERMRGSWVLVRTRNEGDKPQWLLIKHRDDEARTDYDVVAEEETSVVTGRTMEEIASKSRKVWRSNRGSRREAGGAKESAKPEPSAPTRTAAGEKLTAKQVADVVRQLDDIEHDGGSGTVSLPHGRSLDVTNLKKVFFPERRYTKGDLLRYYASVAPLILPAIADRPLVLKRFPNGIHGKAFYQQKAIGQIPEGVRVERPDVFGGEARFIGGDLLTLLHIVQLGAISVDPWHSRVDALELADYTIIDLDPGDDADFATVIEVAHRVHDVLDDYGLSAVPKTSGSTGIHICVPLPAGTPNEAATLVAQIVATQVAGAFADIATIERTVKQRPKSTVYVDYLQNILGKTVAGVYSARATPEASVSVPLRWDEVTDGLDPRQYTIMNAAERFAEVGDLWRAGMKKRNSLKALLS